MNGSKTIQTNEKGAGGLYKNVKIPVRALNAFILLSLAALLAVTVYLTLHGGYTVEFDSAGGSSVESVRLKFGDSIPFPDAPVKEGYRFARLVSGRSAHKALGFLAKLGPRAYPSLRCLAAAIVILTRSVKGCPVVSIQR